MAFRIYDLLGIGAGICLILSFINTNETLDVHVHDTYFVIAWQHVFSASAVILLLLWGNYKLGRKLPWSSSLVRIHTILTLITILTFLILPMFETRYVDLSQSFSRFQGIGQIFNIAILLFLFAQILFLINLLSASLRSSRALR